MQIPELLASLLIVAALSGPAAAEDGPGELPGKSQGSFDCVTTIKLENGAGLLEKVQSAYNKLRTLKAGFVQNSYLAALDQAEGSAGEVAYMKPGLMRWDYHSPEKQTFLVREQSVWFYQPVLNQVIIDKFEKVLISDLPVAFLLGLGDLKHDFKLQRVCRTSAGILFELSPAAKDAGKRSLSGGNELKNFFLLADAGSYLPRGARVFDISGNTTGIVFEDLKPEAPLSESSFEAKFPAGTDVSDRR